MNVSSSNVQITVPGTGTAAYVNIGSELAGYAACFSMPIRYQEMYVCVRGDNSAFMYLLLVEGPQWKSDIEAAGYRVMSSLREIAEAQGTQEVTRD